MTAKKLGYWSWFMVAFVGLVYCPMGRASIQTDKPAKPDKQERRHMKALQKEMERPYKKWLEEEVPYIISDDGKTLVSKERAKAQSVNASQQIVLAESLPLKSLAPGKYTVTIRITDNVRKQTVTPTESFEGH